MTALVMTNHSPPVAAVSLLARLIALQDRDPSTVQADEQFLRFVRHVSSLSQLHTLTLSCMEAPSISSEAVGAVVRGLTALLDFEAIEDADKVQLRSYY